MVRRYNYQSIANPSYWEKYLDRELTREEIAIIECAKGERTFNRQIKQISDYAMTRSLYIPMLTEMYGNCIFESLDYFKLCPDIDVMRQGIAIMMLQFKDMKNFIPGQDLTLNEIFQMRNDIDFVWCKKSKKLYKYNFDAMCCDLSTDCAWTRFDTEIVLTFISIFLNLRIIILHDTNYCTEICCVSYEMTVTIHLGLIGELHYIPLDNTNDTDTYPCPKYDESLKTFHRWGRLMAVSMGRFTDE
jgi:hypothetical protein